MCREGDWVLFFEDDAAGDLHRAIASIRNLVFWVPGISAVNLHSPVYWPRVPLPFMSTRTTAYACTVSAAAKLAAAIEAQGPDVPVDIALKSASLLPTRPLFWTTWDIPNALRKHYCYY